MKTAVANVSIKKTARIAGVWYLILAICGAFAEFFVRQNLVFPGDAATTADSLLASAGLFRTGIAVELIGQVVFVMLVLALFDLLKVVNRKWATLMVVLVLIAVTITCLNMVNQFAALAVVEGGSAVALLGAGQHEALASLFLDLHRFGYSVVAQIFFGLWLLPLGALIYLSGFMPRLIGALLVIAGGGYLADVLLQLLAPATSVTLSEFTFVGEVLLMLWLLIGGVNVKAWRARSAGASSPA